jgi:hypothetical protein
MLACAVLRSNVRVRRDERNAKISRLAVVLALFLVLLAGALLVTCRAVIDSMLRGATDRRAATLSLRCLKVRFAATYPLTMPPQN